MAGLSRPALYLVYCGKGEVFEAVIDWFVERTLAEIHATLDGIAAATGRRPVGWLGAGTAETWNTLDHLVAELFQHFDRAHCDQSVVVDVQEGFRPYASFAGVADACAKLIQAARILDVPRVVSEQYPKGLGHTAPARRMALRI